MRRLRLAALLALAFLLAAPGVALAGGGGHVRAILSVDPPSPRAGDTVTLALRYTRESAPRALSAMIIRPDGTFLSVSLARFTPDTLVGTLFLDRGGTWQVSASGVTGTMTLEVAGDGRVLAPPREPPQDAVPVAPIAALALAPYPFAAALWLFLRARRTVATRSETAATARRHPRASYA